MNSKFFSATLPAFDTDHNNVGFRELITHLPCAVLQSAERLSQHGGGQLRLVHPGGAGKDAEP